MIPPQWKICIEIDRHSIPRRLAVDPTLFAVVIFNLLDNAAKYSFKNTSINVNGKGSTSQKAVLNFMNRGIAILEDEIEHLFEAGFRGKRAVEVTSGGVGLGLFVARQVVERHGGDLVFSSRDGVRGHTFSVVLPLKPTTPRQP
jgi:signal transduction histidine kinase